MSYHILHITTPGVVLYCEKGFLFCKYTDGNENKIPVADLRSLIIATHQVTFTNSCLARLLENDVVILHCNDKYQPTGWSAGLDKVIRKEAFFKQIARNTALEYSLWQKILRQKILNQLDNLELLGCPEHDIDKLLECPAISEGNVAKKYWQKYFETFGLHINREHQDAEVFENICLNYGYAVISTLLYRSILTHGLLPNLGIQHKARYNSTPLVYDFVEPFRAFVDFYLKKFAENCAEDYQKQALKSWNKYLAGCLKNYRLKARGLSYKIIDFCDVYVESFINALLHDEADKIILPKLKAQYLHIDKHRNREYEE
ncbi:CRISPR-associated endonuclease Cas1 [Candidatus Termititenax aidoneus]|uniref:CRISPR-associated endonuclease Cas1 n=1 Tax=Termititenax aidoneus TaxID=2218524 RepID=A0A388T8G6_TERA1|nr:CRISPR-associated endonuclease Cas1 [Candidatus Termititenax aidoneus]